MLTVTASAGTLDATWTLIDDEYLRGVGLHERTDHLLYAGVNVSGRSKNAYRICPQLMDCEHRPRGALGLTTHHSVKINTSPCGILNPCLSDIALNDPCIPLQPPPSLAHQKRALTEQTSAARSPPSGSASRTRSPPRPRRTPPGPSTTAASACAPTPGAPAR